MTSKKTILFKEVETFITTLNIETIPKERFQILKPLVDYVQEKVVTNKNIHLNFICTHNSRRSHLSQVWAQVMAAYFNVEHVSCYSGGTESTALFPRVAKTLEHSGLKVERLTEGTNPIYSIKYGADIHPIIGFSKTYDAAFNPKHEFAAVMTCSHADENCPFIPGAEKRIPVTFEDPKAFDGTDQQAEKYHERSIQIATELFYVFSQIR